VRQQGGHAACRWTCGIVIVRGVLCACMPEQWVQGFREPLRADRVDVKGADRRHSTLGHSAASHFCLPWGQRVQTVCVAPL
jgi:hypothetical protein